MKWIDQEIAKLVKKYKTNNPFELAAYKNIHVVYFEMHPEILGFYKYEKRNKFIVLNTRSEEKERLFLCGHELGHTVMHEKIHTPYLRKNTFFSVDKVECEANYFATHLLLHGENLQNYETTYDLLRSKGIPFEMERFI
ncbi:ImmA/IrrE family metallo-endopeptidase [Heyndrickxia ginsengihumi]|uniref:ImmA/IrrE family metallo-endopeptidase n=1 Tax=Heyndrickxia ginsengihumi TaxID=363870 RepID=UPI000470E264|nr:ImmA/IrrE family metallo-endopeptidase [Heyndrickxia ginsengihumi]